SPAPLPTPTQHSVPGTWRGLPGSGSAPDWQRRAKLGAHEYEKNGSCCVFLAFEPHTGRRYVEVRARRTAVAYAAVMQNLIDKPYPEVECIHLVQDNLHTHTPGAFCEVLPPSEAFAFSQRFEPHYTPLKGAWLNRAEIEFAALAKQCLDRRIPTFDL